MPKQTLLSLTQDVLSAIDGDEVNSISDTVEATKIATLIKRCYLDMIVEMDLPVNTKLTALTGLGDVDRPTHMLIPEEVSQVHWIQYNVKLDAGDDHVFREIKRMDPKEFVRMVNSRSSTDTTNYQVVLENSRPLIIDKTIAPTYWTSFDDEYVVFDAYDSNVDSTLQTSKSIIFASTESDFDLEDDFIPDLPENLFPYLYSKAEAQAFAKDKQEPNFKAEQTEKNLRIRSQRNKWRQDRLSNSGPDYGKRR